MSRIPNELKIHLYQWKKYAFQFTDRFLKFKEMEYVIHYVKFKMCPALIYGNVHCFHNLSIDY